MFGGGLSKHKAVDVIETIFPVAGPIASVLHVLLVRGFRGKSVTEVAKVLLRIITSTQNYISCLTSSIRSCKTIFAESLFVQ